MGAGQSSSKAAVLQGRQARVLDLAKYGWSIPQIADIVGCSARAASAALRTARLIVARQKQTRQQRKSPKPVKRKPVVKRMAVIVAPSSPPTAPAPTQVRVAAPVAPSPPVAPPNRAPSPLASADLSRLMPRQFQVVKLHLDGLGNGEIGKLLKLTSSCVSVHLAQARRRLGIAAKPAAWRRAALPAAPEMVPAPSPPVTTVAEPAEIEIPEPALAPPIDAPVASPAAPEEEGEEGEEVSFEEFLAVDEPGPAPLPAPAPVFVPLPAPPRRELGDQTEDEEAIPAVERARSKINIGVDGRIRSKTLPPKRIRDERWSSSLTVYPEDVERPQSREECANQARPCPFVSCAHHLYLDVNPESGAIKLNFPHLEVWEMAETCSLDVADRGGITLEDLGGIMNLTRERIRQVELGGLRKIREGGTEEMEIVEPPLGNGLG